MSVIIYGPQGCGKTRNKTALAQYFGLTNIIDDWTSGQDLPKDTLALTNDSLRFSDVSKSCAAVGFYDVIHAVVTTEQ